MTRIEYLIYFSQEHKVLPLLEIESCLKTEGIDYEFKEIKKSLCIISSKFDICKKIAKRLAFSFNCGLFLFKTSSDIKAIEKEIKNIDNYFIKNLKNKSFRVKIKNLISRNKFSESYEREVGKIIKDLVKNAGKVDLKKPDIEFLGLILNDDFYFTHKYTDTSRNQILSRSLKDRPFIHPSAINQLLAHVMINLSQANEKSLLLDPFCGTGTFLIEAHYLNIKTIGIDIDKNMIKGSLINLKYHKIYNSHLIQGDIKNLMFSINKINSIVSDPPYGRSSSTHKKTLVQLINNFFQNSLDLLKRNGYICIALPEQIDIKDYADANRLEIKQDIKFYVHKSLTRKILVLKRK
ncbi:MAG: methyltransferase domain-containing protein [Candidatus Lokiarchaeota archaeon]|nr:methyltransferase domain-containing protein [Candidatus Lokiarchaeota archaeon]